MPFGDYLRKLRINKRVRLRELSNALGISITYLSDIEINNRNPFELDKITKTANFLELNPKEEKQLISYIPC